MLINSNLMIFNKIGINRKLFELALIPMALYFDPRITHKKVGRTKIKKGMKEKKKKKKGNGRKEEKNLRFRRGGGSAGKSPLNVAGQDEYIFPLWPGFHVPEVPEWPEHQPPGLKGERQRNDEENGD